MAVILLDSSVIFDDLNGRRSRTEFLAGLIDQDQILACCAVNATEIYASLRPGEERPTEAFLSSLEFVPVTVETARQAGILSRKWREKGQTLSYTDVTLAAVALVNRYPLLTDNRKHFPMEGLELPDLP